MVGMANGPSADASSIANRGWLQLLLLLAIIAVLLSPALRAEFLWDDFKQIAESPTIDDLGRIPFYFTHNVVESAGGEGRGAEGVDTYRPLFMVTLAAVYQVNGPDPFWFHASVLAAHLLVCALLWCLAIRWIDSSLAAAIAVFFFACHPVTAEAYLWPSALPEPLAAAGLLGAVLILDHLSPYGRQRSRAWVVATVAGIVFFAGLLSKEIVLAGLLALGLFLVASRKVLVRYVMPATVAVIVFLVMRAAALDGMQAAGADATQRIQALKVYPVLLVDGLHSMLTMQPIGIRHLSWEYAGVSWSTSCLAAALCVVILVVTIIARRIAPLAPTAALTTGLMLAPIALVATVPGWGGFGRYLYVPLAVTSLALADLGLAAHTKLETSRPLFRWAVPAIVAVVIISEIVGLQRALHVYANQENLARAAIEIFPDGPDGWEWLGNVYLDRGELEAARECYREATERAPELYRPRHNLAAALLYTGHPAEALEQLEILNSLHPPTGPGSKVAVDALMALGRWDEAGERLVLSLDRDPNYGPLGETASRLLDQHPHQTEFRAWLEYELGLPEHRKAAIVLRPMLGIDE
jgi:hypothetical protein